MERSFRTRRNTSVARHYSHQPELIHPLALAFLAQLHLAGRTAWDTLVEDDNNAPYRAWLELPPADRDRVERMLRHVHEMASEAGTRLLVNSTEAEGQGITSAVGEL